MNTEVVTYPVARRRCTHNGLQNAVSFAILLSILNVVWFRLQKFLRSDSEQHRRTSVQRYGGRVESAYPTSQSKTVTAVMIARSLATTEIARVVPHKPYIP